MSRRIDILTSDIERGVREVLARGLHDPRVSGLITVTGVKVLPDQTRAFIDISVFPEEKQELTVHGIASAGTYIRREVSKVVRARVLPEFVFRLDTKLKKEAAILRELDKVKEQRRAMGLPDQLSQEEPSANEPGRPDVANPGQEPLDQP